MIFLRHHLVTINNTGDAIENCLNVLSNQHGNELKHSRQERYLQIGRLGLFSEKTTTANEVLDNKYGKSRPQQPFYLNTKIKIDENSPLELQLFFIYSKLKAGDKKVVLAENLLSTSTLESSVLGDLYIRIMTQLPTSISK